MTSILHPRNDHNAGVSNTNVAHASHRRVNIRRSRESIKDKLPEAGVSQHLLARAVMLATKLRRSDLIMFWLDDAARHSEASFDQWLKDLPSFSKQELIDIIHELGSEALQRFVNEFSTK